MSCSLEDLYRWRDLSSTCQLCSDFQGELLDLNIGNGIDDDEHFWIYVIPVRDQIISEKLMERLNRSLLDFFEGTLPTNIKVVSAVYIS